MRPIDSFDGEHRFLSNFWIEPVMFEDMMFPSTEHSYQAAKSKDKAERSKFQSGSAGKAKRLGRRVKLRKDWESVKYQIMKELVLTKFSNNPDLKAMLLATGNRKLIEGNTWGDKTWGCVKQKGTWVGKNWLGKILMEVREELR